jgi:hypothetical protein
MKEILNITPSEQFQNLKKNRRKTQKLTPLRHKYHRWLDTGTCTSTIKSGGVKLVLRRNHKLTYMYIITVFIL